MLALGDGVKIIDMNDQEQTGQARVLVAVSGGIACYKAAALVSLLVKSQMESGGGLDVRVIMTPSATEFVTPLTFQSLSGQSVLTSMWESDDRPDSQHIGLARWCDVFCLVPATANTIASIAHGFCDELVTLTAAALPRETPALFVPAMNADMWAGPIVQQNCATLREALGWQQVGPEEGWQACRTSGAGRMAEPEAVAQAVLTALNQG